MADVVLFEECFFLVESLLLLAAFFDVLVVVGFGSIADAELDFLAFSDVGFLLEPILESLFVTELMLRFKDTFSAGAFVRAAFKELVDLLNFPRDCAVLSTSKFTGELVFAMSIPGVLSPK
ncbi:hypothetical protein AWRI1631_22930 [Saccharomyces cerevisiae AWRI1631]|uniref:Uncharacterized protein n=1 Tax=Saccharomyces cerevisiae (strain AWRI1631) TaxID=545124 RepID=B5VEG7_YEAS6|nr:hypothetical protein AWRI1631_22930 [Saccharomyces cerevisiae AWRI1631]